MSKYDYERAGWFMIYCRCIADRAKHGS